MGVVGAAVVCFTSVDTVELLLNARSVAHKVVTDMSLQGATAELPAPGGKWCMDGDDFWSVGLYHRNISKVMALCKMHLPWFFATPTWQLHWCSPDTHEYLGTKNGVCSCYP